ncbi:peptidylprolyl isomerase [Paraburkholderia largidicola]|uniref:peptidylprolyl isomerase n=1 Tax=Paraburkholderia largidicola TaxID=3014751 RepID=A0A7I8C2R0_9BURK|nr:peptidyl-prolyl cis-trans isomerase [Paraburkholderia sp. PGU16]BCF94925.1 peptidylprolyl isomerase [Paraburkholderia sp. PGU16]
MKRHLNHITFTRLTATLALAVGLSAIAAPSMAANKPSSSHAKAAAPVAASGPLPANAVARVNNVFITQEQVDAMLKATNTPDTPQTRTAIKNQLIARELFRQAAEKQHYDTRAQVIEAVEQARSLAMTQAYLRDQVRPTPVTDADVKARYDAIVATLGDKEYKPSVIAVKDEATAKDVLAQLKKGTDFAQLAKQYSQGPAAAQGGAMNWVSFKTPIQPGATQGWPQPVAEAMVKLPQGGLTTAPVQVGDAFWIVKMDQERVTQVPDFDTTRAALRQQLEQVALQKATAQVVVDLMKNASIQQQ